MHIAFDAKRIFYNHAGLGNYSRNLLEALCSYYPDNRYTLFSKGTGNERSEPLNGNLPVIVPKGIHSMFPSLWRTFGMLSDIERFHPDIYHGLSHELPYGIQHSGVKSVVTIHDLIFVRYPQWYKPIDRFLYTKKYRHACAIADQIIAIGSQTANDLQEFWHVPADKIEIVRQSCNPVFWNEVSSEEKLRIKATYNLPDNFLLQVGTIEPRKNHMATLNAMAISEIEYPMVIVGKETAFKKELCAFIENHNLSNRVVFLHHVPLEHLPAFYSLAKLTVYPSVFEGFGIPVLESLVCNTPVITSRVACFEDAGGDAACYVAPDNPDEFAEQIDQVLRDTTLYAELQASAKKHIQFYTPQSFATGTINVYEKILGK